MSQGLVIDVYFDLICPWCLIGKRHLDQALIEFAKNDPQPVTVRWHSVQLLPDLPDAGLDFMAFYTQRLGSVQAVRQRQAQVSQSALRAGADINFQSIARMPNTRRAHQLLSFAKRHLAPTPFAQLVERLFAAHFSLGEDLGSRSSLFDIAREFDLSAVELTTWMDSDSGLPASVEVPGVPFFVFNGRLSLSGAQPPDTLLANIRQSLNADTFAAGV